MEPDVKIISPGLFASGVFPDENVTLRGSIDVCLIKPFIDTKTYSSSMALAGKADLAWSKQFDEQMVAEALDVRNI